MEQDDKYELTRDKSDHEKSVISNGFDTDDVLRELNEYLKHLANRYFPRSTVRFLFRLK